MVDETRFDDGQVRRLARQLAAAAVREAAEARRPRPDACGSCADWERPVVAAMDNIARELEADHA